MQFGTNAAGTSGATLRLSDGVTAGSASFTLLTINGSGHKVVGGAAEAGTLNFNLSSARTVDAGLSLGGAGVNEDNFNVVKTGAGVLTLSGANTFNGFTRLDSGGGIVLANENALQNSTLTLNGGGSVVFSNGTAFTVGGLAASASGAGYNLALTNSAGAGVALTAGGNNESTTYAGVMSGAGSLIKSGNGTLTLTAANTYSGGTTVNGGALAGTVAAVRGNIANNASVIFNEAAAGTYGDVMSGSGTLVKRGAGTLTLTNANTYSGVTAIEEGALLLNSTGSLAVESGVVVSNGALLVINRNTGSIFSNAISGAGGLSKAGTGDLTLAVSNSHTGGTTMGANNLTMGANGALGHGALSMDSSANTSRLILNGTTNTITGLTLTAANAQVIQNDGTGGSAGRLIFEVGADQTVASASTLIIRDRTTVGDPDLGTLSLVKTGGGTLDLSEINTAATRYSGGLTINAGAVNYTNLFALGDVGSTVTLGGGKLNYTGSTDITNSRAVTLVEATTSTMENAAGTTVRYTGTISGSGNLTKDGIGTLDLAADNSYTGNTLVSAGALIINGDQSAATGVLSVSSGAILGGAGTIGGAVTVDGSLRPGNSMGTLTVNADTTWNSGDAWVFELGAAAPSLEGASTGGSTQDLLAITGAGSDFLKGTGSSWTFDFAAQVDPRFLGPALRYDPKAGFEDRFIIQWLADSEGVSPKTYRYFEPVKPDFSRRDWTPTGGDDWWRWRKWIQQLAPEDRFVFSSLATWQRYLDSQAKDGQDVSAWRDSFPAQAPGDPAAKALWERFVAERYPLFWQELNPADAVSLTPAWQAWLAREAAVPDAAAWQQMSGATPDDGYTALPATMPSNETTARWWCSFVKSNVPVSQRVLLSSETAFADFLAARHGTIEKWAKAWAIQPSGWEEARFPLAEVDFDHLARHETGIKWDLCTANFRVVLKSLLLEGGAFTNTFIIVLLSIATSLTINPLAAYALSRFRMRGTNKILIFLLATMALPAEVAMVPGFLLVRDLHLTDTFWALVLPGAANAFSIFLLKGFFDSLPQELYEAALIDGAGEFTLFTRITIPLSMPIIAVTLLGTVTHAYNLFMPAVMYLGDVSKWPIATKIYEINQVSAVGVGMAALVVSSIFPLLVFVFCQRIIMRGIILPSMK